MARDVRAWRLGRKETSRGAAGTETLYAETRNCEILERIELCFFFRLMFVVFFFKDASCLRRRRDGFVSPQSIDNLKPSGCATIKDKRTGGKERHRCW